MNTCIYCRSESKAFTREHVIPRAFGVFGPNTWVLSNSVCGSCNQLFGDTIDRELSRGSIEGLSRWNHGIKRPAEAGLIIKSKISAKLIDEGELKGLLVNPVTHDPIPQVGFKRRNGEREFIALSTLRELQSIEKSNYDFSDKAGIFCFSIDPITEELLTTELNRLGITFSKKGDLRGPEPNSLVQIEYEVRIDRPVIRALAKIAFNFTAYLCGNDFMLRSDFDHIRDYIRIGVTPRYELVLANRPPMLAYDSRNLRQTNAHLLGLTSTSNGSEPLVKLSLFNNVTYDVVLCKLYSGAQYPDAFVRCEGYSFDPFSKSITPLHRAPFGHISPTRGLPGNS